MIDSFHAAGTKRQWPFGYDSMVVDERGDRKGFPPAVALELTAPRGFYAELHPRGKSAWDPVHSR